MTGEEGRRAARKWQSLRPGVAQLPGPPQFAVDTISPTLEVSPAAQSTEAAQHQGPGKQGGQGSGEAEVEGEASREVRSRSGK